MFIAKLRSGRKVEIRDKQDNKIYLTLSIDIVEMGKGKLNIHYISDTAKYLASNVGGYFCKGNSLFLYLEQKRLVCKGSLEYLGSKSSKLVFDCDPNFYIRIEGLPVIESWYTQSSIA